MTLSLQSIRKHSRVVSTWTLWVFALVLALATFGHRCYAPGAELAPSSHGVVVARDGDHADHAPQSHQCPACHWQVEVAAGWVLESVPEALAPVAAIPADRSRQTAVTRPPLTASQRGPPCA